MANIERSYTYFNDLLEEYRILKRKQERELSRLPVGTLGIRAANTRFGDVYYCRYIDRKRYGITKDDELVSKLARKKYLQESLCKINSNINSIEQLLKTYENYSHREIISVFPHHYSILMDSEEAKWNEKKRRWLEEDYEQSKFRPAEKIHVTSKDLYVRSKSEVIVSERLEYYRVPNRYEQVIYIGLYEFAPDFTILTRNGIVYWEHCGKINDAGYLRRYKWKMTMYESVGIVPWKNLILTYDDEDGSIDTRIIDAEIINKLLI